MVMLLLILYTCIAAGAAAMSAFRRMEWRVADGQQSFWLRNNLALSVFWPLTITLLAVDAAFDYQRHLSTKKAVQMHAIAQELKEAQDAIDAEIHRPLKGMRRVK